MDDDAVEAERNERVPVVLSSLNADFHCSVLLSGLLPPPPFRGVWVERLIGPHERKEGRQVHQWVGEMRIPDISWSRADAAIHRLGVYRRHSEQFLACSSQTTSPASR